MTLVDADLYQALRAASRMDELTDTLRAEWKDGIGQLVAGLARLEAAVDRLGESIHQRLDRLEARVDRLERPA